jgi:hypothetical protein
MWMRTRLRSCQDVLVILTDARIARYGFQIADPSSSVATYPQAFQTISPMLLVAKRARLVVLLSLLRAV